ncbi:hypothetical protein HDV01_006843 [Terramyces sp. JEL0728]|nr:hypothetical protein HDV01_006843 [Terramyces sp. JEL0728]
MADYRKDVMELAQLPANKVCIDCGAHTPQWASVTFGTFFCLECSGGVHITFVRSVTMDKWSDVQAKRMQLGGNQNALEFFKSHPDYREKMSIPEKYNSEFAVFYKEKLTALCNGDPWTMPPVGSKRPSVTPASTPTTNQYSMPTKEQNENFFATRGDENKNRPDNLPPSAGGKYGGFGNSYEPPKKELNPLDDPMATISKGWSMFSSFAVQGAKLAVSGAETLGKTVNEQVIKPTTAAVRDPEFNNNISSYVSNIGQKFTEVGSKGFVIASETAAKGYDMAQSTISQVNGYASVPHDQYEERGAHDAYDPWMPKEKKPEPKSESEWDDWDKPSYENVEPTPAKEFTQEPAKVINVQPPAPKANDEWEDF